MSRSIFISNCGDPILLSFVYKLLKKNSDEEFDKLYININNNVEAPVKEIAQLASQLILDPKVHLIYHPNGIGNGPPFTELTRICREREDLIMLMEDDHFIYTSGVVDEQFKKIESKEFDAVGSLRYAFGEVAEAAQKQWNLDYSGVGDVGFGFWPNFFFCKREDLLKTDLDFGSKHYPAGVHFSQLNHTFKEDCYTDTFTWASIQLRALKIRIGPVPQHHADPYEVESKQKGEMNWINGTPKYIHGGSLSAGFSGYLSGKLPDIQSETNMREIESRVAWWTICVDEVKGFEMSEARYRSGISFLVEKANLDKERINQKINLYKQLIGGNI